MRNVCLSVAAAMAVTLLSCGQKGALVLPDAQHPHRKIGAAKPPGAPAPTAQPSSPPSSASPARP